MQTSTTKTVYAEVHESTSGVTKAIIIMRYWNQNQFPGRFKTLQTEWAETVLSQTGIDPSTVGVKKQATAKKLPAKIHQ